MDTNWLDKDELAAWVRVAALLELLPGVLDTQLRRDAQLSHFEYYVLAMLSEAPDRTLRMTSLAAQTNATLPRLSHVVSRLSNRGLLERYSAADDKRATDVRLTRAGWAKVRATAPGHVANVREHVIDTLSTKQIGQLTAITDAILRKLDPDGAMSAIYQRHDHPGGPSSESPS